MASTAMRRHPSSSSPPSGGGGGGGGASGSAASVLPLIRPSHAIPWGVDFVQAVPRNVVASTASTSSASSSSSTTSAASCGRWHCCSSNGADNKNNTVMVWYDAPDLTDLASQKSRGPYATITLPTPLSTKPATASTSANDSEETRPLLLALNQPPSSTTTATASATSFAGESVYVYAAHPSTGTVYVYKIYRRDLATNSVVAAGDSNPTTNAMTPRYANARTAVPLAVVADDDEGDLEAKSREVLTSLNVTASVRTGQPRIVAGTSTGRMFWIQQIHVPLGLNVQSLPGLPGTRARIREDRDAAAAAAANAGFFSSLLLGRSSVAAPKNADDDDDDDDERATWKNDSLFQVCWSNEDEPTKRGGGSGDGIHDGDEEDSGASTTGGSSGGGDCCRFYAITKRGRIVLYYSASSGGDDGTSTSAAARKTPSKTPMKAASSSSSTRVEQQQQQQQQHAIGRSFRTTTCTKLARALSQASFDSTTTTAAATSVRNLRVLSSSTHQQRRRSGGAVHVLARVAVAFGGSAAKGEESRLYWIRLSPSGGAGGGGKKLSVASSTWLDRFPSEQVRGVEPCRAIVAVERGDAAAASTGGGSWSNPGVTAYAAFNNNRRRRSSGTATSADDDDIIRMPTIFMCLESKAGSRTGGVGGNGDRSGDAMEEDDEEEEGGEDVTAAAGEAEQEEIVVHEVDVPVEQIGTVWTLQKDVVTYGCLAFTSSGCGLRVCLKQQHLHKRQKVHHHHHRMDDSRNTLIMTTATNPTTLATLTSHIRSTFWGSYRNPTSAAFLIVPPSLQHCSLQDLEHAVIEFGNQLIVQSSSTSGGDNDSNEPALTIAATTYASPSSFLSEWHDAYIDWLQKSGLFRSLSPYTRWNLLGIGQQIAAYEALVRHFQTPSPTPATGATETSWEQEHASQLRSNRVADWLFRVQRSVLQQHERDRAQTTTGGTGQNNLMAWYEWLCLALDAATEYRIGRAPAQYDLGDDAGAEAGTGDEDDGGGVDNSNYQESLLPTNVQDPNHVPLWTSHPVLRTVLSDQIAYWKHNDRVPSNAAVRNDQLVTVVTATLRSFADAYACCPDDFDTHRLYAQLQQDGIALLRGGGHPGCKIATNDRAAFVLCKRHCYFRGLCEIAYDHERRSDKSRYRLDPLLRDAEYCESKVDLPTGYPLPDFVLQWHCNQNLLGHVFDYGTKYCLPALQNIVQREETKLRPYRWICDLQPTSGTGSRPTTTTVGNNDKLQRYHQVSASLLEYAEDGNTNFYDVKRSLGIASIANAIVTKANVTGQQPGANGPKQLKVMIDKLRERANAQEDLLGARMSQSSSSTLKLWPADRLVDWALHRCDEANATREDKVHACLIGLAVCTTFANDADAVECAASVWCKAIIEDWATWQEFVHTSTTAISKTAVRDGTVFGALVDECDYAMKLCGADTDEMASSSSSWASVHYRTHAVERQVYQKLAANVKAATSRSSLGDVDEVRRLLQMAV